MKFTIPKQFNDYTLREIFQYLKLPKKDLHQLNMSKEILINKEYGTLLNNVKLVIMLRYQPLMK